MNHHVPRFWKGCAVVIGFWLVIAIIAGIVWRLSANEPSKAYIQHVIYRPNVGIAWLSGGQENATKLAAFYWYSCCSTCPPPGDRQIPILRPGTFWANCPGDYEGHILVGNEGEFCPSQDCLTPAQMAQFIEDARGDLPDAIFVCLNSYDLDYMLDVIALLSPGTCQIYGVHVYDDVDIGEHLAHLQGKRIWITELGACGSGAYERLKRQVGEARQFGVERVFGYTAVNGNNQCLDMLDGNGDLRPSGLGFVEGQAYP